jgi:hypothetical protein
VLKLDLQETEAGTALVLAAVIAGQTAENLGTGATVKGLNGNSVSVTLTDAGDRLCDVYAAHLERNLGQGFLVEVGDEGLVTVRLDEAEDEAAEEVEASDDPAAEEKPKPRRGRPPGTKSKPSAK